MITAGPRILVIDDNAAIHEDFRKIFAGARQGGGASPAEVALFGPETARDPGPDFRMDSVLQGHEGLERVKRALEANDPYSVAFIDVRMPPGWDGIETTARI
ncbi:MAG: hypothetical protein ABI669_08910, partial [Usitatibacter sp.]